jgi:hypothetical protein
MSRRIGGSQPRLDRRKIIPNPIRMYAPIADFDFMVFPPEDKFHAKWQGYHLNKSSGLAKIVLDIWAAFMHHITNPVIRRWMA